MRVRGFVIALLLGIGSATAVAAPPTTTTEPATTSTAASTEPAPTVPATVPAAAPTAVGQPPFPADSMTITAASARVWNQGSLGVSELAGPVRIDLGPVTLTADAAVVWIRPPSAAADGGRPVDVVLVGHAVIPYGTGTLLRDRYWIPAVVSGPIRLVGPRAAQRDDQSLTYRTAVELIREQRPTPLASAPTTATTAATTPATKSTTTRATTARAAVGLPPPTSRATVPFPEALQPPRFQATPVRVLGFGAGDLVRQTAADGNLAEVCTGGVNLSYRDPKGTLLEFTAANMVLFTDLKDTRDLTAGGNAGSGGGGQDAVASHIVSGYFDGDVRVFVTPASASKNELRMRADRVYYEFATDRAVMTDVVMHTVDARKAIPVFMRAAAVRQLSEGEFKTDGVTLSTSAFATPSYGLSAAHAYVRAEDSGDPRIGERVAYSAQDVTLDAFGVPILYFPAAGGTMTARGSVFRGVSITDSNGFGPSLKTDWGLFETLGEPPPEHVDANYRLDYYGDRGPATGLNGSYTHDSVTDVDRQPDNLAGDLQSYFVYDHGVDVLGADRANEDAPESFRGRVRFEHEQDVGDHLVAQVRLGWDSDSNFMPQWFRDEYENALPINESVYLKHADGPEVASFLTEWQPNRVVTTADAEQENREVESLPQLRYQRLGDSLVGDRLTFFSDDSATGNKFVRSDLSPKQQGFYDVVDGGRPVLEYPTDIGAPGLPAYAYTGDPGSTTFVGDARQEVDVPLHLGAVNVVPYAVGRYTVYSQGAGPAAPPATFIPPEPRPDPNVRRVPGSVATASDQNRLLGAVGVRMTTDLWRVDDSVQSDLLDLHRIRHVISPELTLFASGQTVDQDKVFIYDPSRDALNDVQAAQIAVRQRWQTKRGGAGHWRSADVLTLDLYANLFANQPAVRFRDPADFRSVFLSSEPEFSLPRNTANAEATWRISDTTALLGAVVQNLDENKLATANIGLAVIRGDRLNYFLGTRYIADLNSNVATLEVNYQLDRKYTILASEQVDLAQSRNVDYSATLVRRFDTFVASVNVYYNQSTNDSGFGFNLSPNGLARSVGSGQLQQLSQNQ